MAVVEDCAICTVQYDTVPALSPLRYSTDFPLHMSSHVFTSYIFKLGKKYNSTALVTGHMEREDCTTVPTHAVQ